MEELLDNDERRIAMGEAAVEHAATFSWAAAATQLEAIYADAMSIQIPDCHERRAAGY